MSTITRPGEIIRLVKIAVSLAKDQDGYFLCVYVKIATISKAVVSIICNSSYVLIKSLLSGKVSRSSEKHVPRLPG